MKDAKEAANELLNELFVYGAPDPRTVRTIAAFIERDRAEAFREVKQACLTEIAYFDNNQEAARGVKRVLLVIEARSASSAAITQKGKEKP